LKVVFIPDFNVKSAEKIYPAADLSEQISTAGTEASGTGNMKFTMNGALTIGTLDGANKEIREAVGEDNFFLFGKTIDEIDELRTSGYQPREIYQQNDGLRAAIDLIDSGFFSGGDSELFRPLTENLLNSDPFLVLADFQDYVDCQRRVSDSFPDRGQWLRKSILNVARCAPFSSDRAVREYSEDIWGVTPVPVQLSE
jgi:starch phosphorylase